MKIICKELGPIGTNAYLVWNESTKEALLIDAPHEAKESFLPIIRKEGLTLKALLITHGHWDHIGGAKDIAETGAIIYGHKDDQEWIEDSSIMNSRTPPEFHFEGTKINHFLKAGDKLELIGEQFEIRHVPGHAPGNILIYNAKHDVAFVGDAIFAEGIGRYDLPGGSFRVLEKSIKTQIYTLPGKTRLLSGHGPETTVAHEKVHNPYVKA